MVKALKYRKPKPVDFNLVILNLSKIGVHLDVIKAETGIPRSTLSSWKNYGTNPNHTDGEVLVLYYCERLGVDLSAVPRKK